MLIDTNHERLKVHRKMLREEGFHVFSTSYPDEARHELGNDKVTPGLVLITDLDNPSTTELVIEHRNNEVRIFEATRMTISCR